MKRFLVVEDEKLMCDLIRIHLEGEFELVFAYDGAKALQLVKEQPYDLLILDIMIPFTDGFDVCKEIRRNSNMPILMLTARSAIEDRVKGLQLGADDYLVKPFDFEELKARVNALLRRSDQAEGKDGRDSMIVLKDKKLIVNKQDKQVVFCGRKMELTAKEYAIIELLAGSPNKIFTREEILDLVWDYSEIRDVRAIDSHIKNIRLKFRKLHSDVPIIKTVWGLGYQLELKDAADEA
ncbi:response regulator transcription factor [Planococcus sp. ISL-109]|uniref:response regulator transcription factor n=1 Tax=Planococcus sp. ISL-109 TaxID=2819166 RepID=UPI001BE951C0|nr:response regulator transcription factor [Planococcus sp. ISL-109]MBT2583200.1 response regulator transcription factor [Planococcus sp. ISL-109]